MCTMEKKEHEEEDVDFEPEDDPTRLVDEEELGSIAAAKTKFQKLRLELENCKAERQQFLDGWQRCKADAINSRKDLEREAVRISGKLREALIEDIIPALDSFDMALGSPALKMLDRNWQSGMENVRSQLLLALKKSGVKEYGQVGDAFDPLLHEIVEEIENEESGKIARVLRKGYRAEERILRPAHVAVGRSGERRG